MGPSRKNRRFLHHRFDGLNFSGRVFLVSSAMIQRRRLKADPVNPLFEHGHREAQAVALGNCLHFVTKQRPSVIDRATGGAQAVLRPMSQRMDYLALIDNAEAADELVEPL